MAFGLLVAASVWAGCGEKKATEFVAGISSQVQVPRDLQTVVVTVSVNGVLAFNNNYPVYDGHVRLPKTLGVVQAGTAPGTPINISVIGFDVPQSTDISAFSDQSSIPTVGHAETAANPTVSGGGRILRSATQPYRQGEIIYLPMPLHFSCYDVDCGPAANPQGCGTGNSPTGGPCTCKGGLCTDPTVDPNILPPYSDPLIFGDTATCFRPFTDQDANGKPQPGCMDLEVAPQPVGDPSLCIFALPNTPSAAGAGPYANPNFPLQLVNLAASGGGLNVRAVFDNLVSEVLDYEGTCPATWPPPVGQKPEEGYCIYADAPQKFRLAPGLCQQYLGQSKSHVITLMEASGACPPKTEFQPICDDSIQGPPQPTLIDGGQSGDGVCNATNPLKPAKSALYVLFDKSSGMRDFLGPTGLGEVLGLSLTNPVFQQTQVGLMYPPAIASDCVSSQNEFALDVQPDAGGVVAPGTVPFEFSGLAQGDIANSLLNQGTDGGAIAPGSDPWYLEAALAGAYTALQNISGASQFNRRAVMVFYDRDFKVSPSTDCPQHQDAITEATAALGGQIETYAVYLANADYPDGGVPGQPLQHGQQLAQGLSDGGTYFFNATSQKPGAAQEQAGLALASVIADLGSCVYEVPLHFVPGVHLSFPDYDPIIKGQPAPETVTVSYSPNCYADDSTVNPLYVFDNQHIRICQNTCERLVTSIKDDEIITAQRNAGNPATPFAQLPLDVSWGYTCGSPIPDASIVESGSAPTSIVSDAGSPVDAGSGDGAVDAATD